MLRIKKYRRSRSLLAIDVGRFRLTVCRFFLFEQNFVNLIGLRMIGWMSEMRVRDHNHADRVG